MIQKLKEERKRFEVHGHDTTEHDVVIMYLETGHTKQNPNHWELLDACMNDYDTVLSDYEC